MLRTLIERRGSTKLRIVTTGIIASMPVAGLVAHYLQYATALRDLGHEVLYLEDTGWWFDPWSGTYVDTWTTSERPPTGQPMTGLGRIMEDAGLGDSWAYVDLDGEAHGLTGLALNEFLGSADVLLHVSGATILRDEYLRIPHRAYIDTDPGFVQMRTAHADRSRDWEHLLSHTVHFSFGTNIGEPRCLIPDLGLTWHPTVQPIDLTMWPAVDPEEAGSAFTTIMSWTPYPAVEFGGVTYGLKDAEFLRFADLPKTISGDFEIAMEGPAPLSPEQFNDAGWRCRDALTVTADLGAYRRYLGGSRGEWSIAKQGYVASRSGWFSERSACYLASGRPVIAQSTGFERSIPTGEGLFSFATVDDVAAAVEEIDRRYRHHCAMARQVAEEHFGAAMVLTRLLETVMASPPPVGESAYAMS